jgi:hypothetical protein
MRIAKSDVPEMINVRGAIARQAQDFGDATGYGKMAGEYFSLAAEGEVTVSYKDGYEETIQTGDLFYWPPGHSVRANKDTEVILFSPQAEHCSVVDHLNRQLAAAA